MGNWVPASRSIASLTALCFVFLEGFLFLGGSFGEFQTRFAATTDGPEPLTLNDFPYSLLAAAAILIWIYVGWVAGASIERDQYSVRKIHLSVALLVLSSLLVGAGLMLVITFEMQSDDVIWYTTSNGAYILIGLPLVAAISLWLAAGRSSL